ncbi:hypothetical protein MASR1M45_02660 [Candidatus Kapaibacterium sp.]
MERIKIIKIENIKGIQSKTFNLDIIPNKPSLLVAPNGYGKSSFAVAFDSLNSKCVKLDEDHFYNEDLSNKPKIEIIYVDEQNIQNTLLADENSNTLNSIFDIFVINNRLTAKATTRNMGRYSSTTSQISVSDIELIKTIPSKAEFSFSIQKERIKFGKNGKIFPNIDFIFKDMDIILELKSIDFKKFTGKILSTKISNIIEKINLFNGSTLEIKHRVETELLQEFKLIDNLEMIVNIISKYTTILDSEIDKYLSSIMIISVYNSTESSLKNSIIKYAQYKKDKKELEDLFDYLQQTWKNIKPKEDKKKRLIIEFPSTHLISNGERDIITFIALLQKAKRNFKKNHCILIIDEVFDYLDDANLIAVQYHFTQFIKNFREEGKIIYPLILTHLNPNYFKNFYFKDQKTYFLNKVNNSHSTESLKLILKREDQLISENVSKFHLHYNPSTINISTDFQSLGLNVTWGDSQVFYDYCKGELLKYLQNQLSYDAIAVCCAIRIIIEMKVYNELKSQILKNDFLIKRGTKEKLEFASSAGVDIPEIFIMLGIIYNSTLHTKINSDILTPLLSKLENLTIKRMIKQIESI